MRQDLSGLSDEAFLYACGVLRRHEWFPSAAEIESTARSAPRSGPTEDRLALPEGEAGRRLEEGRAMFRKGLEMIEAELRARGVEVRRPGSVPAVDSSERREQLRQQAEEITR